jgi:hypothetical protein
MMMTSTALALRPHTQEAGTEASKAGPTAGIATGVWCIRCTGSGAHYLIDMVFLQSVKAVSISTGQHDTAS